MANQWTKQQQQAISLRNRNLLVSAAAGSGKTAVLVERIIEMITDEKAGIDIDQLLVVTFTRAAALEMKERIGQRLTQMLEEQPHNQHLQQQYTLLNHASITTIDSFCLKVVKEYFNELDMDPDFRIAEEGELKLLEADTLAAFLEEQYKQQNPDFLDFVNAYSTGKTDAGLEDYILQVWRFAESYPYPDQWLEEAKAHLVIDENGDFSDLSKTLWMQNLMEDIQMQLMDCDTLLEQAVQTCTESDGPWYYEEMLLSDRIQIQKLLECTDFPSLYQQLQQVKFVRKPSKKDQNVEEEKKALVSSVRDFVKSSIQDLIKQYCVMGLEEIVDSCRQIRRPMTVLLNLAAQYREWFTKAKREKNLLDFGDLEHLALEILVHTKDGQRMASPAAKELRKQYQEILIDEYQDSNYLQEAILTSISKCEEGQPNIFMVGDIKQSIYRFRQARPELFQEKYKSYSEEDSSYQKISLYQNFRSRKEVLQGINLLFEQVMTERLGSIVYDENAALHAGAVWSDTDFPFGTELLLLHTSAKEFPSDKKALFDAVSSKELEAKMIAQRIRELTDAENGMQIFDKTLEAYRTVQYKDIVILLRSFNGWSDEILNTLLQEGIPAYAQSNTGYFSALEVQTVLNVLRIIDNPCQDIPLAAVLVSPIVGLTSSQMAEIAALYKTVSEPKETGLYEMIRYYLHHPEQANKELYAVLQHWSEELTRYREQAVCYSVQELLHMVLDETGYYDYVTAMPSGKVRQENLDMLIQKAITYEKTSYHGVFHFVRYIENLQKYEVDYAEGSLVTENDDIVRITSIHKSKGLEYPVVILAGLGKGFNKTDSKSHILLHPDMGIASEYIDYEHRYKVPTLAQKAIARQLNVENSGEELRILYVAMTRAKEKLILTGTDAYLNTKLAKWEAAKVCQGQSLPYLLTVKANSYLDWVLMALQRYHPFPEEWMRLGTCQIADGLFTVQMVPLLTLLAEDVRQEVEKQITKEELLQMDIEEVYDENLREKLQKTEVFTYPYTEDMLLHTKVSVSELKRMYDSITLPEETSVERFHKFDESDVADIRVMEEDNIEIKTEIAAAADSEIRYELEYDEEKLPNFMKKEKKQMSAAMRGTSYHRIMELMDETQNCLYHTKAIRSYLEQQALAGKIDHQSLKQIDFWKIYHFYQTELGERMIHAAHTNQLYKEQQFIVSLPACEIYPDRKSRESVLVQGIIDAFFEENGELVLIDYKTDHVRTKEELLARYRAQFYYYRTALEQITGKRVKESWLYSFALGEELQM